MRKNERYMENSNFSNPKLMNQQFSVLKKNGSRFSSCSMFSRVWLLFTNILPVLPVSGLLAAIGLHFGALTAVHIVDPLSLVIPAICPYDPSVPIELILFVLTFIDVGSVKFSHAAPSLLLVSLPDPIKFFVVVNLELVVYWLDQFFLLELGNVEGAKLLPGLDSLLVVGDTWVVGDRQSVKNVLDPLVIRFVFLSP